MMQKLRLIFLAALIIIPSLANATLVVRFGASIRSGCTPLNVDFSDSTITTSGHTVSHNWMFIRDSASFDVDTLYATTGTPHISFVQAGYYRVIESVYDSTAPDSGSLTVSSYIYVAPQLALNFSTTNPGADTNYICMGKKVTFVNTSSFVSGCNASFRYFIHGPEIAYLNTTSINDTPSYVFNHPGSYDVSLILDSACSGTCRSNYIIKRSFIRVDSFPIANFSASDTSLCSAPVWINFTNLSSGADSFAWRFGDGGSSNTANPRHKYLSEGIDNVTLIAFSTLGHCRDTLIKNSYINIGPKTFGFLVTHDTGITPSFKYCVNDAIVLHDTTSLSGTVHYTWHDDAGHIFSLGSTSSAITVVYSVEGTYTITDSAYIPGCYGFATHTITVNPLPTISITPDHSYKCSVPDSVYFYSTVSTATPPFKYMWNFGDDYSIPFFLDTSSEANPRHIYSVTTSSGTFDVLLQVSDNNLCGNSVFDAHEITIDTPILNISAYLGLDSGCTPFPFIYNTYISPIGVDSIPYTIDSITHVNDPTIHSLPLAPIPRNGTDTIRIGAYYDTVRFYFHLPAYLGGVNRLTGQYYEFSNYIVLHVGNVHPAISTITFDSAVCPNTPVVLHNNCSNCASLSWRSTATGFSFYHIVTDELSIHDTTVSYNVAGYYKFTIIGDLDGCTDTLKLHDTLHIWNPNITKITVSDTACADTNNLTLKFTAATLPPIGEHVFYRWTWGDGFPASVTDTFRVQSHVFPNPESSYLVTVYDSVASHNCVNHTDTMVNLYNFISSYAIKDSLVCKGKVDSFIGPIPSYAPHYAQYLWNFGDGGTFTTATSNKATHIYTVSGNYPNYVVLKNTIGCTDTVNFARNRDLHAVKEVHVGGPSGGATASPTSGCSPITVMFQDNNIDAFTSFGLGINRRWWLFNAPPVVYGDSTVPSTIPILGGIYDTVTFPEGNYTVILTDSDAVGCSNTNTIQIYSQHLHAYFNIIDRTDVAGCIGHQYQFHDTNTHCLYHWDFGDGHTATGQNPTHAYTATGTYTTKVWVTSDTGGYMVPGCTDSFTSPNTITIDTMNASFYLSDSFAACPPLFVIATNTTIPPPGGYNYYWRVIPIGEIVDSTTDLYTTILTPGTTSQIMLITQNAVGCRDSASHNVRLGGPGGKIVISDTNNCAPLWNNVLTFVDTNGTSFDIASITWYPGDGTVIAGAGTTITYSYPNRGLYHPYVILDGGGCGNVLIPDTTAGHYTDTIRVYKLYDTITSPSVICFGDSIQLYASGGGIGGTYQWLTGTGLSCSTCDTVIAHPTDSLTFYSVVITTSRLCVDTITTYVVRDSLLSVHITGTGSICAGSADTLRASGSVGTYLWSPSGILDCTTCDTVISTPPITATVTVVFSDLRNCHAYDTFTVNVRPIPRLMSPSLDSVCDNTLLVYGPTSSVLADTIKWTRGMVSGISNAPGAGTDSILETLHDTTVNSVNVQYTYHIVAAGCSADTSITITVFPTPKLWAVSTDTICSGRPYFFLDSSLTNSTSYSWYRSPMAGILPDTAYGNGNIFDTLTNTSLSALNPYYIVLLTSNGCIGRDTVGVHVNPTPVLSSVHNVGSICHDSIFHYIAHSNLTPASYTWRRSLTSGISDSAKTVIDSIINEKLSDTTHGSVNVSYTFTVTALGCSSDTNHVNITVRPASILSSAHKDTICTGTSFVYLPSSLTTDSLYYTWNRPSVSGISPATSSGIDSIHEAITNSGTTPLTSNYIYTINNSGCIDLDTVKLVVALPGNGATVVTDVPTSSPICTNVQYQNFGANIPPSGGMNYVWSATNATIVGIGNTTQYCLITFNNPNVSSVITVSSGISAACKTINNQTITVNSNVSDVPVVIYFEGNLYCLNSDETSYQWGYDDMFTYEGFTVSGQTYQNYYLPGILDSTANRYYWVKTISNSGCIQKSYYNAPNSVGNIKLNNSGSNMRVYPNPTNGLVNIDVFAPTGSNVKIEVFSLMGQKLITSNAISNKAIIDVSELPNGSYYVVSYLNGIKYANTVLIKN